jgi:hypothetical protein
VDILHNGPHNGEAARFCGKGINLIGSLPHIAKETFNGIGTANVAMHDRWKRIKRQQMLTRVRSDCGWLLDSASGIWL